MGSLFERVFDRLTGRRDRLAGQRNPALHGEEPVDHRRIVDVGHGNTRRFEFAAA